MSVPFVGLVGDPGSGKSELRQALGRQGCEEFYIGDVVRERAKSEGFIPAQDSREAYLPYWQQVAAREGKDWIAQMAHERQKHTGKLVVADGLRIPEDARYIVENGGLVLFMHAPEEQLINRIQLRGRPYDANALTILQLEKGGQPGNFFQLERVAAYAAHCLMPIEHIGDDQARAQRYDELATYILEELVH